MECLEVSKRLWNQKGLAFLHVTHLLSVWPWANSGKAEPLGLHPPPTTTGRRDSNHFYLLHPVHPKPRLIWLLLHPLGLSSLPYPQSKISPFHVKKALVGKPILVGAAAWSPPTGSHFPTPRTLLNTPSSALSLAVTPGGTFSAVAFPWFSQMQSCNKHWRREAHLQQRGPLPSKAAHSQTPLYNISGGLFLPLLSPCIPGAPQGQLL